MHSTLVCGMHTQEMVPGDVMLCDDVMLGKCCHGDSESTLGMLAQQFQFMILNESNQRCSKRTPVIRTP